MLALSVVCASDRRLIHVCVCVRVFCDFDDATQLDKSLPNSKIPKKG